MKQGEHVTHEDVVGQLFPLGGGELTFLIFLGQFVHAGLVRVAEVEGEDASAGAGCFSCFLQGIISQVPQSIPE